MNPAKFLLMLMILISAAYSIDESKHNQSCLVDTDCDPPFLICSQTTLKCKHKPLFPLTWSEILGALLIAGLGSLAAAAGLGGGLIVIPIVLLMFGVTVKQAAALSNVVILVNSTAKFITAIGKKDPLKPTKTLIDYQFILMFNPVFVFSNVIGSILNKMLPSGFILFMLIFMVLVVIIINVRNGLKRYREENTEIGRQTLLEEQLLGSRGDDKVIELKDKQERGSYRMSNARVSLQVQKPTGSNRAIINPTTQLYSTSPFNVLPHVAMQQFNDPAYQRVIKYEGRDFDPMKYAFLFSTVLVVILFSLLRGSGDLSSIVGMEYCGGTFWFSLVLMIAIVLVIAVYSSKFAMREIEIKAANNDLKPHELNYDVRTIVSLNSVLFVFGIVSNILGLGGGMFIYPIFTSLGMQPLIISNTAVFMLLLSKIVAVFLNYMSRLIIFDLSVFFIVIVGVSAILIIQRINQAINRYKRQSIITGIMVFILLVSLITAPVYAYLEGSKSQNFWKFKSYC